MHCKNYLVPRPIAYMIPYHEKVIVLIILLQLLSSPSNYRGYKRSKEGYVEMETRVID